MKLSKNKQKIFSPVNYSDLTYEKSVVVLKQKIGENIFNKAADINFVFPSPVSGYKNTDWCRTLKITGINPRITKTYWGIVKYAMSFPESGIHIMPLFETGDGSLYVQNSWELNNDFLDKDLCDAGYDTSEKQLKLIINMLHAMGKIVGFDALSHCDNFSKIVLLNPNLFEWVKLNENKTAQIPYNLIDYNNLYKEVENVIIKTLNLPNNVFSLSEEEREKLIFPKNANEFERRMELRKALRDYGLEPVPVVEHAPNRPILFKNIQYDKNESWAEFYIPNKNSHAKIFGAITPYKLYLTDENGYPEKNNYNVEAWDYFSDKINEFQKKYNFDFLRADMAHNQISHSHNEETKDITCPELWAYVKSNIRENKPYFATMAEAFFATYYIDGITDMINKDFDIVLGEMNFKNLDKLYLNLIDDYVNPFRENFPFFPCITVFTNDGDMEIHNEFYPSNRENSVRYFVSMFLNLPSYTGMGFELRDINPANKNNYSHDYVKKQIRDYAFGNNINFWKDLCKIRKKYIEMKKIIDNGKFNLIYALNNNLSLCFEYISNEKNLLILVNLNENNDTIELKNKYKELKLIFSFDKTVKTENSENEITFHLNNREFAIYEFKE